MGLFTVQGLWSPQEQQLHSNLKELKAVLLALKALLPNFLDHRVIQVVSDNTTVVWYINKQGGTKSRLLMRMTWELLLWCETQNIQTQAKHIAGILNVIADTLSRKNQVLHTEWILDKTVSNDLSKDIHANDRSVRHEVQSQVTPVCVASPSRCDAGRLEPQNAVCIPSTVSSSKNDRQVSNKSSSGKAISSSFLFNEATLSAASVKQRIGSNMPHMHQHRSKLK